jgi:hypothetical protein
MALGFVSLILGSVFMGLYGGYETHSIEGRLIATTVTVHHQKRSTSYIVQEIFSYPVERDNEIHFANCSRASKEFSRESRAWGASHGVILGTTRPLYLSKSRKDHSCIDRNKLNTYFYVGVSMLSFVGFSMLSCCFSCWLDVREDSVYPMPAGHKSMPDSYASDSAPHSHAHWHGYAFVQQFPMQIPMQQLQVATAATGNLSFAV